MPTSTTLNFLQILLLMEAMDEYTDSIRSQVAAGDTEFQETLSEGACLWTATFTCATREFGAHFGHMYEMSQSLEVVACAPSTPSAV